MGAFLGKGCGPRRGESDCGPRSQVDLPDDDSIGVLEDLREHLHTWVSDNSTFQQWGELSRARGYRGVDDGCAIAPCTLAQVRKNLTPKAWTQFLGRGLIGAAAEGHVDAVERLLTAGAILNARDVKGSTALHRASFAGHTAVVARLLAEESEGDVRWDASKQNRLVWETSSRGGHFLVPAASLMKRGTIVDSRDNTGCSPLHHAAAGGHLRMLRLLLLNGADPQAQDAFKRTPLHVYGRPTDFSSRLFCCLKDVNDVSGVLLLVQAGADPSAPDLAGRTPLQHAAAVDGAEGIMDALVKAGTDLEARGAILGRTALHEACATLRIHAVRKLLALGSDETSIDGAGMTPSEVVGTAINESPIDPRDVDHVQRMIARAPADRLWRRRAPLLMLRHHFASRDEDPDMREKETDDNRCGSAALRNVVVSIIRFEQDIFRSVISYL